MVVDTGVDHDPRRPGTRQDRECLIDQDATETATLMVGIDRQSLHIAGGGGLARIAVSETDDDESCHRPGVVDHLPGPMSGGGTPDRCERSAVHRPQRPERGTIQISGAAMVPASQGCETTPIGQGGTRVRRHRGVDDSGVDDPGVDDPGVDEAGEQHQGVDAPEPDVSGDGGRWLEQCAGADRVQTIAARLRDGAAQVVWVDRLGVVALGDQRDGGVMGPGADANTSRQSHRRHLCTVSVKKSPVAVTATVRRYVPRHTT